MSISDDLDNAADYIEEHGWIQFAFADGAKVCVLGGIDKACMSDYNRQAIASDAFRDYVGNFSVGDWNDKPYRTAEEVIQTLRDCATKNRTDSMTAKGGD